MKKIVFAIIILVIPTFCFAKTLPTRFPFENNEYVYKVYYSDFPNPGFSFEFKDNTISLDIPETDSAKHEEGIYIRERVTYPYKIKQNKDFLYLYTEANKYLVLYYEDLICILVDCKDYTTYCGVAKNSSYVQLSKRNRLRDVWIGIEDINSSRFLQTSSFLQEELNRKSIKYDGLNDYMWQIQKPWCEGVKGNGIGEWIQKTFFHKGDKIILLNGYINPNHPDYYYKNGRIKDINIITEKSDEVFTLKDIPQLQVIDLDKEVEGNIKLIIKSVYDGKQYQDTCLSFFCLLTSRVD